MTLLAAEGPHVSLVAEPILQLGSVVITNSMLLGILGTGLLIAMLWHARNRAISGKHTRLSVALLSLYEILVNTATDVLGDRAKAMRLAPIAISIFLVIMINNWIAILPFVPAITHNGLPLFRGLAADLNFTMALAIISMVTAQIWAIRTHGVFGNLGRYFGNPIKNPMHVMEGFLELIAEFSRLISLSMRLFGNIFGGEVLLVVIAFITSYVAVVALPPFMLLELFVGAVQAYVFFMLTVVFVALASSNHAEEDNPEAQPGQLASGAHS